MFEHVLFPLSDSHPFFFCVSSALQFTSPEPAISFLYIIVHTHTYIYSYIERFVFCFSDVFVFLSTHKKVKKIKIN